ncbi:MAG: ferritin [Myxococcota bacterium]|jgi:ferritin|nr:ferritin [Myxococcota bacterium]
MKITETMQQALNTQLNFEIHSAHVYLALAATLDAAGLQGAAGWMKIQAKEELEHGMKFYKYLYDRQGEVVIAALPDPKVDAEGLQGAFAAALAHEQEVTRRIHALVDLAAAEKDHATASFLKWFVDEQVEEEANVEEILGHLNLLGASKSAYFMLDRQLGKRAE